MNILKCYQQQDIFCN